MISGLCVKETRGTKNIFFLGVFVSEILWENRNVCFPFPLSSWLYVIIYLVRRGTWIQLLINAMAGKMLCFVPKSDEKVDYSIQIISLSNSVPLSPSSQHDSRQASLTHSLSLSIYIYTHTHTHTYIYIFIYLLYIYLFIYLAGCTMLAQWLRCCATNRKVAGSIPAGVTGIFRWHKILPIALWPWGRLSL